MKIKQAETVRAEDDKRIALHYMTTLVDVARESFLILDADLKVVSGNPIFYETFQVTPAQTEGKSLYELGNSQWNIPELKKLLEEILPKKKVVKNYEVTHNFETIGKKTMVLNGRQIDTVQLIILAIEDISLRKELEEKLAKTVEELEIKVEERTKELSDRVKELELLNKSMVGRELKMVELKKEVNDLNKTVKTSGGENGKQRNGSGTKNS